MPTPYAPGCFVWYDLMTTDRDGATNFYSKLFDWTVKEQNMGPEIGTYVMLQSGDDGIGGMVPLKPEDQIPSHWIAYIAVDDVDKTCERAKELGGGVPVEPFEIPNVGRMAVIRDSTGAHFSPFKDAKANYDLPDPRPGLIAWNELMSSDVEKANAFYTDLIGWNLGSVDNGEKGIYWMYRRGDRNAAGAVQMPDTMQVPSYWLPYINVANVLDTVSKAQALGAQIYLPPTKMGDPANVHFAVLASPDGAAFGIVEM